MNPNEPLMTPCITINMTKQRGTWCITGKTWRKIKRFRDSLGHTHADMQIVRKYQSRIKCIVTAYTPIT